MRTHGVDAANSAHPAIRRVVKTDTYAATARRSILTSTGRVERHVLDTDILRWRRCPPRSWRLAGGPVRHVKAGGNYQIVGSTGRSWSIGAAGHYLHNLLLGTISSRSATVALSAIWPVDSWRSRRSYSCRRA